MRIGKVSFLDKWLKDKDMKTYDALGYYPDRSECPPNIFNTFKGFAAENMEHTSDADITPILYHLKVLVNYNDECYNFLIDWLAHIIQKPSQLNGIAVVINGQHGCGKDIFINWFSEYILGMQHVYKTATPNKDIFDLFNSARHNKLLIHIEEANKFVINSTNVEAFKNMITDKFCSIRKMRTDVETNSKNYNRFILTTNNNDPFNIADTERRFFAVKASSSYCKNNEYFSTLLRTMYDVNVQYAFFTFLMDRDITNRNWLMIPETDYLRNAKLSSVPNIYHFLHSYIEMSESEDNEIREAARSLYFEYRSWCGDAEYKLKALNERDFSITLRDIEGMERHVTMHGRVWEINKKEVCKGLQKKFFDCCCNGC
jgi:putative DNA primase/helicase